MTTLINTYEGGLRTTLTHTRSGQSFISDAPPDNLGKGEAFSPTDLVCAAFSSCMLTTMGIVAERDGIDMIGMKTEVVKIMTSNPRKIAEIQVTLSHPNLKATPEQKQKLRNTALTCPVALSLHEAVKQTVIFNF
jgi:putative redox protein